MLLSHRLPRTAHALAKPVFAVNLLDTFQNAPDYITIDTVPLVIAMQLQASHASHAADTAGFDITLLTEWNTVDIETTTVAWLDKDSSLVSSERSMPCRTAVSPVPARSQFNAALAGPSYCFGVIFPNQPRSPKWFFSVRFLHRNSIHFSFTPSFHIPRPSPPP
jgi:hypothetical protein